MAKGYPLRRPSVADVMEVPSAGRAPEELVRQYFEALRRGRVVDALDVFSTDAVLWDEAGTEHRGIRAIAASFVHGRSPTRISLISVIRSDRDIATIAEIRRTLSAPPIRYRAVFSIDQGRVRSLTMTRL